MSVTHTHAHTAQTNLVFQLLPFHLPTSRTTRSDFPKTQIFLQDQLPNLRHSRTTRFVYSTKSTQTRPENHSKNSTTKRIDHRENSLQLPVSQCQSSKLEKKNGSWLAGWKLDFHSLSQFFYARLVLVKRSTTRLRRTSRVSCQSPFSLPKATLPSNREGLLEVPRAFEAR